MAESHIADVKLSIDSQFENIELVQGVLEDSLQRADLDDDTRYWIGIAVREAVANAIKHGNRQDPEKKVTLEFSVSDEELRIAIMDEGEGFDPSQVADPLEPDNLLKPSGRGIFYMKKFMDDIQYSFGPNGGTIVTLIKKKMTDAVPSEDKAEGNREMKIETREREGVTILDLKGKITIGVGDVAVRDAVQASLDKGSKNVLLNMEDVSTMDSSGIGEIVAAYTTVTNRGGKLRLYGIPPRVSDILQITQLVTVLDILDDEEEAVASFR